MRHGKEIASKRLTRQREQGAKIEQINDLSTRKGLSKWLAALLYSGSAPAAPALALSSNLSGEDIWVLFCTSYPTFYTTGFQQLDRRKEGGREEKISEALNFS